MESKLTQGQIEKENLPAARDLVQAAIYAYMDAGGLNYSYKAMEAVAQVFARDKEQALAEQEKRLVTHPKGEEYNRLHSMFYKHGVSIAVNDFLDRRAEKPVPTMRDKLAALLRETYAGDGAVLSTFDATAERIITLFEQAREPRCAEKE